MNNCPFNEGDRVENHGICGTVIGIEVLGNGWILQVELDSGDIVSWDCAQVTQCTEERA